MPRTPTGPRAMTSAERQAKRRGQFRQMREALERIAEAETVKEARAIAAETLACPTGCHTPNPDQQE